MRHRLWCCEVLSPNCGLRYELSLFAHEANAKIPVSRWTVARRFPTWNPKINKPSCSSLCKLFRKFLWNWFYCHHGRGKKGLEFCLQFGLPNASEATKTLLSNATRNHPLECCTKSLECFARLLSLDRREQRKLCNLKWLHIQTQEATLEAHHDKKKLLKLIKFLVQRKRIKSHNFVSLILSNCFCNATRDAFITNQSCDKFCDSFFFCSIQVFEISWVNFSF